MSRDQILVLEGNAVGRDFIFTDLHGSLELFKKVVLLLKEGDRLFHDGDFIDRGPESFKVIEFFIEQVKAGKQIYATLGNHEDMALRTLDYIEGKGDPEDYARGMSNGEAWISRLKGDDRDTLRDFIERLPCIIRVKSVQQGEKTIAGFDLFHAIRLNEARLNAVVSGESSILYPSEIRKIIWSRPMEVASKYDIPINEQNVEEWLHRAYLGHTPFGALNAVYQLYNAFVLDIDTPTHGRILVQDHTNDRIHEIAMTDSPTPSKVEDVIRKLESLSEKAPSYSYPEAWSAQKENDEICKKIWGRKLSNQALKELYKGEVWKIIHEDNQESSRRTEFARYLTHHDHFNNEITHIVESQSDVINLLVYGVQNSDVVIKHEWDFFKGEQEALTFKQTDQRAEETVILNVPHHKQGW